MHPKQEKEFISRADALLMMESYDNLRKQGVTFSITFVKCDRHRHTGGKIVTIQQATLAKLHKEAKKLISNQKVKNANQWENKTRNILDQSTNSLIKVHIDLITRINDIRIVP